MGDHDYLEVSLSLVEARRLHDVLVDAGGFDDVVDALRALSFTVDGEARNAYEVWGVPAPRDWDTADWEATPEGRAILARVQEKAEADAARERSAWEPYADAIVAQGGVPTTTARERLEYLS